MSRLDRGAGRRARCWLALACWLLAPALALALVRPLCAPDAGDRCIEGDRSGSEYFYRINGHPHMVDFAEGNYYVARCDAAALGDPALPRFPRLMTFNSVVLEGCTPPAGLSYAAALRALNVSVKTDLTLRNVPAGANFSAVTFSDLSLERLDIAKKAERPTDVLVPSEDFLDPLTSLKNLALIGVRPTRLPANLKGLRLRNTHIEVLPPGALNTVTLEISESSLTSVEGTAPRLETLVLIAPVKSLPLMPVLKDAMISLWTDAAPGPLQNCSRLESLTLTNVMATALPDYFVAACPALKSLELSQLPLRALPPRLLFNSTNLVRFKANNIANLTTLPAEFFTYSPNLQEINLSLNQIQSLPGGLFSSLVGTLQVLALQGNRVRARDVEEAVAPVTSLTSLDLSRNPLGDLCPDTDPRFHARGMSALSGMRNLSTLHLSGCGLARVCADWLRELQRLRRLDLTRNRVAALACADLRVHRTVAPADLDLSDNPLRTIACSQDDFDAAADAAIPQQAAKVIMNSQLDCDCRVYWAARTFAAARVTVQFEPVCGGGGGGGDGGGAGGAGGGAALRGVPLRAAPLDALACALPADVCAPGCDCEIVPHLQGVRAACRNVSALPLAALARAPPLALRELRAPGAGVAALPDDLPDTLKLLDLSDNRISNASEAAAARLFAGARRVRLAGNPLACDCARRDLLDALRTNRQLVIDYENTTCADGRGAAAAARALAGCAADSAATGAALAALLALGAGVALAAALGWALARPAARHRLKVLLRALGWRARREDADAGRRFDAFVVHADEDARLAHERLAARLEPARRLCLPARDWPAGAWIPAQIEASVRASRRTLCLVTPGFLAARWARAALQAAHAAALLEARPRVLLVLHGVARAELAPALRAHPALRWGEPRFWEKLEYELPAARAPPAAAPPAPPAAA